MSEYSEAIRRLEEAVKPLMSEELPSKREIEAAAHRSREALADMRTALRHAEARLKARDLPSPVNGSQ